MAKKRKNEVPHSPGNWKWHEDGRTLLDGNGDALLRISDLQYDHDANVIVACPALVKACQRIYQALMNWGPTDDGTAEGKEVEKAMDEVMEALLFAKYGIPVEPEPDIFEEE